MRCPKCNHEFPSPVAQAGGRARSQAKRDAARRRQLAFWLAVSQGLITAPRVGRKRKPK